MKDSALMFLVFRRVILSMSNSYALVCEFNAKPKSSGVSLLVPQLFGDPGFLIMRSAMACR